VAVEILNTIVSHCGLRGKAGIGSTRRDVFQIVSSMEQELCAMLSGTEVGIASVAERFKLTATVLGYGSLTSRSSYNCEILKYDGQPFINGLKDAFGEDYSAIRSQGKDGASLRSALMMWLTVSARVLMNADNATFLWELMEIITSALVGEEDELRSPQSILETLRGIEEMNQAMIPVPIATKITTIASKHSCTSNLFKMFTDWNGSSTEIHRIGDYFVNDTLIPEYGTGPSWFLPFKSFITREIQNNSRAIIHGASMQAEGLMQCLDSPLKQWCAFHILFAVAGQGGMLYTEDAVSLSDGTNANLDSWQEGLDEEEAMEVEEDVMISAQCLPHHLMSSLETWKEESLVHDENNAHNEHAFMARLLEWLLCLEFLDSAATTDMRNRAHITSYIKKTGAIKEVFDIALSFSQLEKQEHTDLFGCISIQSKDDVFSLSQLSTLAIFRSIESMPTLCKFWWNDDCPRGLSSDVNKFVESMVAPETLRRELQRINAASNLGELSVSGSCVSREIVATYMQDECKLSLKIRIPPSFPLRNAEVDCQKTLGISEKRWRYWSLQIMRMLNSQDGSVLDALLLWKQNVDKEFVGVEPCPVCYSVLCVKTHAMPNLECKTCHNRFHSSCLYKWFNSSGNNQCVLCQQPWSGTKIA
jgi:hypothetical protein